MVQSRQSPVTGLEVHALPGGRLLVVSTAGDDEVHVWEGGGGGDDQPASAVSLGQDTWVLRQRITVGSRAQLCVALASLPADPDWCAPQPPVSAVLGSTPWRSGSAVRELGGRSCFHRAACSIHGRGRARRSMEEVVRAVQPSNGRSRMCGPAKQWLCVYERSSGP
jgi:hypothetical protein